MNYLGQTPSPIPYELRLTTPIPYELLRSYPIPHPVRITCLIICVSRMNYLCLPYDLYVLPYELFVPEELGGGVGAERSYPPQPPV